MSVVRGSGRWLQAHKLLRLWLQCQTFRSKIAGPLTIPASVSILVALRALQCLQYGQVHQELSELYEHDIGKSSSMTTATEVHTLGRYLLEGVVRAMKFYILVVKVGSH